MQIDSSVLNKPICSPYDSILGRPTPLGITLSTSSSVPQLGIGAMSVFDELFLLALRAQLVDSEGWVLEDVKRKYPLKALTLEEIQSLKVLLENPILRVVSVRPTAEFTYTLLEYFKYQISEVYNLFGIEITSINVIGGKVPELLKKYYIRTLNDLYTSRCRELNLKGPNGDLISEEVAADFDRKAPDTDFVLTIKFDTLKLLTCVGVHYFAEKLPEETFGDINQREAAIIDFQKRLISKNAISEARDEEIKEIIETGALTLVNSTGTRFFADKLPKKLGKIHERMKIIKNSKDFYDEFFTIRDFSLASFDGFDTNIVHEKNINKSLFLHHSLRLNIQGLIKGLVPKGKNIETLPKNEFLLLKLIPEGGLQSLFERAWRRLRVEGEVNDRALFAYLLNKSIGYGFWDPHLQPRFFNKVTFDPLPKLKKAWDKHHCGLLALIPLAFNAILALPENRDQAAKAQMWWTEMMHWYEEEKIILQSKQKPIDEDKSPFFLSLKETLNNPSVSFNICKEMLQVHGSLLHSSPQPKYPTSNLKALITNPETIWHEVSLFQKIDGVNYAIAMPLNLFECIPTLLKAEAKELEALANLTKHLCPQAPYGRELIPARMVTEKLADEALNCLDHPHKALKSLGYEVLLLHALSTPKPKSGILKNLLKYLPAALESIDPAQHPRLKANFEEALKGFPDSIETHKLTSPIIEFFRSTNKDSAPSYVELCFAMVSTNDPELILAAVSFHLNHDNISLDEHLRLVQTLLQVYPSGAAKLIIKLQKENLLSNAEEANIFAAITDAVKKQQKSLSQHSQLLSLSNLTGQIFQANKSHARRVALQMAEDMLSHNLLDQAQKWMVEILKLASKSHDQESLFFIPQKTSIPMLSLDLPPNPVGALETLSCLREDELKLFIEIASQQPHTPPNDLTLVGHQYVKKALLDRAIECLKHTHPYIKRMGFELLMVCAATFTLTPKVTGHSEGEGAATSNGIDPLLLTALISYLPLVLSAANPQQGDMILNGMKTLFLRSTFAMSADNYFSSMHEKLNDRPSDVPLKGGLDRKPLISKESAFLKELYQANCLALASTRHLPLCQVAKDLLSNVYLKKLLPGLKEIDQIEIAFTVVYALLPENFLLALDILKLLEKENNEFKTLVIKSRYGTEKKEIFAAIVRLLIEHNHIQIAKEQLLKCLDMKNNIFRQNEVATTEVWLMLFSKSLIQPNEGPKATIELWQSMKKLGGMPKQHFPAQQIDFMICFIESLYSLNNTHTDNLADELQSTISSLNPSNEQKYKLFRLIISDLRSNPSAPAKRLNQSYQVLKYKDLDWLQKGETDRSSPQHEYLSLLLLWLNAAKSKRHGLQDATVHLLSNSLRCIVDLSITGEDVQHIIEVCDLLIQALKEMPHNAILAITGLKEEIKVFHPIISRKLQTPLHLDRFFHYLESLNSHQLLEKPSVTFANQALWLADLMLKTSSKDLSKLKGLHELVKSSLSNKNFDFLQIDDDKILVPTLLAKAFLDLQLYAPAKEWIDMTIKMQKSSLLSKTNLTELFISWCESFLMLDQPQYSLSLFKVICNSPNNPSDAVKAQLCIRISKALFSIDASQSMQLLLDNWELLKQKNVEIDLQAFLKDVIQNALSTSKGTNSLKLFSPLIDFLAFSETDFLVKQFQNFTQAIKPPVKEVYELKEITDVQQAIASLFFTPTLETIDDEREYEQSLHCRFRMLRILSKSDNDVFICVGMLLLNEILTKKLSDGIDTRPLKSIGEWADLCNFLLAGFSFNLGRLPIELSTRIISLFDNQSLLIKQLPYTQQFKLEKELELKKLCNQEIFGKEIKEVLLNSYCGLIQKYAEDKIWIEAMAPFLAFLLIDRYLDSRNISRFIEMHYEISGALEKESNYGLSIYLMCLNSSKKQLDNTKVGQIFLFVMGVSLIRLTEKGLRNQKHHLEKVLSLVQNFFFNKSALCSPIEDWNWSIDVELSDSCKKSLEIEANCNDLSIFMGSSLELSNTYFANVFSRVLENLEKLGYDEAFPRETAILQLLTYSALPPIYNENDQAVVSKPSQKGFLMSFNDDSSTEELVAHIQDDNEIMESLSYPLIKIYKNVTLAHQISAAREVMDILCGEKNAHCSAMVLKIFENLSEEIWIQDLDTMTNRFINFIKDDSLYPAFLENMVANTFAVLCYYKKHQKSFTVMRELYIVLHDQLQKMSIFSGLEPYSSMQKGHQSAIIFLSNCVKHNLVDKNNEEFEWIFETQLDLLRKFKVIEIEHEAIVEFISNSLENSDTWSIKQRKSIFEIIDERINIILIPEEEWLKENLMIIKILELNGFFKYLDNELGGILWNLLFRLYPKAGSKNLDDYRLMLALVDCLFGIFINFPRRSNKDYNVIAKMKESFFNLIAKSFDKVIVDNEDNMRGNLFVFGMLSAQGYYKTEGERKKTLQMLVRHFIALKEKHGVDYQLPKLERGDEISQEVFVEYLLLTRERRAKKLKNASEAAKK